MKRQSLVLLAVAFVAAGAAGCFKDPVSNLRNGPSGFTVDHSAVNLRTGDSTAVTAYLLDDAGNQLAVTGASWTSTNPAIAVVRMDTTQSIPGAAYTKGFIRGVDSTNGGWANVIVTSRGVADTIRVTVIPAKLVASHIAFAGPSLTDTVISPPNALIPGDTAKYYGYTASDTLILNGSSTISYDTTKVGAQISTTNGTSKGIVVSKTPSQVKVMFQTGAAGKLTVFGMLLTPGNSKIGTIAVDTIDADSIAVAPIRIGQAGTFGLSAAVLGDTLTVTSSGPASFTSSTSAEFDNTPAIVIAQTPAAISLFSAGSATASDGVTLYKVEMAGDATVGTVTLDSVSSSALSFTLSPAVLPIASLALSPNNARLFDTLTVSPPAGMNFTAGSSQVILGTGNIAGDTAYTLTSTASTLKVFARRGNTGPVTVTNLELAVAGAVPFNLTTPAAYPIDSSAADYTNALTQGTAHPLVIDTTNTVDNPVTVYGAAVCPAQCFSGAPNDYWTFTTTATRKISVTLTFWGNGKATTGNPELDATLCDASSVCDESAPDILKFKAAVTGNQPQSAQSGDLPAAQYWINILPFFNTKTGLVYQLQVSLDP